MSHHEHKTDIIDVIALIKRLIKGDPDFVQIEEVLRGVIRQMIDAEEDGKKVKNPLAITLSDRLRADKSRHLVDALEKQYFNYATRLAYGLARIINDLPAVCSSKELVKASEEMDRALTLATENLSQEDTLTFIQDETYQKSLQLSDMTMKLFYMVGRRLFQQHEYKGAIEVFTFITFLNSLVSDYWLALGVAQHQLRQFEDALTSLAMSTSLDLKNKHSRYFSILTYLKLNEVEEANLEFVELKKLVSDEQVEKEWEEKMNYLNTLFRKEGGFNESR